MKRKKWLIPLMIILSSVLFIGCSNTKNDAAKASHKTHQKGAKAHFKSNKKSQINHELLKFLGITQKDYKSDRKSGKSIADIAKEKSKTEQEVIDFLENQREEAFKKKNPNVSQDTLNEKKQQWNKKITTEVEKTPKTKKGA